MCTKIVINVINLTQNQRTVTVLVMAQMILARFWNDKNKKIISNKNVIFKKKLK